MGFTVDPSRLQRRAHHHRRPVAGHLCGFRALCRGLNNYLRIPFRAPVKGVYKDYYKVHYGGLSIGA